MKNNKTINMDKLSNLEKQQLLLLLNKIEDGDIIKIGEKYFTIKQLG